MKWKTKSKKATASKKAEKTEVEEDSELLIKPVKSGRRKVK